MANIANVLLRLWLLGSLVPFVTHADDTALQVIGEVKTPLKLTIAQIKAMPVVTLRATDHDGATHNYEGVPVNEILKKAEVPQGEALRGDALQLCAVVSATDGYQAVFALAELDPLFTDSQVLLSFRRDGAELDANSGPLRLVVPGEK